MEDQHIDDAAIAKLMQDDENLAAKNGSLASQQQQQLQQQQQHEQDLQPGQVQVISQPQHQQQYQQQLQQQNESPPHYSHLSNADQKKGSQQNYDTNYQDQQQYHKEEQIQYQQQQQSMMDMNKEFQTTLIACQEIFQNHIGIICQFDSVPQGIKIPQEFCQGLDNRLRVNYLLLHSSIESVKMKPFYHQLQKQLLNYICNNAPKFDKEESGKAFDQFVGQLQNMEKPQLITKKGKIDGASVSYTMGLIAKGQNRIDANKGKKQHYDFQNFKQAAGQKMMKELDNYQKGIQSQYQKSRMHYKNHHYQQQNWM